MKRKALNKQIISLAVLLVAAAALGIVVFALSREGGGSPEPESVSVPAVDETVYIIQGTINALTIQNEHGEFTVRRGEGDEFRIPALERFPQDTAALSSLLYRLSHLRSQGTLEGIQNLAPFGLSTPRAVITVELEDGERRFLAIGAEAPDGRNIYVSSGESDGNTGGEAREVQLADSYDLSNCFRRDLDFLNLAVTPASGGDGQTLEFERIELGGLVRGKEPVTIVYSPLDETSTVPGIRNPYRITSPLEINLSLDRGIQPLQALFGLTADSVAAVLETPASRTRYGLDKPYSIARVRGAESFSLIASAPDDTGRVYLTLEGRDIVYTAAVSKLPWLDRTFFDLMDRLVVIPFIDRIAEAEVIDHERGSVFSFALSGEGDDLVVRSDNAVIDTAQFRAFYQTLLTAMYDEYYDGVLPAGAAPLAEILYRYRDGSPPDRVSFYPGSSRRVLTVFNGGRPFYTHRTYVDKLLKDCTEIREGKKVLPYL
ncbi:MAG: DUF4340 domain-containing protein [Treponema sp.]|nr:DUF4340 domain-containing protein [Treponema sp.]